MLKTASKFILLLILLIAVAGVSGYLSYVVTSNILRTETLATEKAGESEIHAGARENAKEKGSSAKDNTHIQLDHYIVRLEGEELSVYASSDGREEFLYNEPIYVNDLSAEDIEILQSGVNLDSSSELTGFIENFTS